MKRGKIKFISKNIFFFILIALSLFFLIFSQIFPENITKIYKANQEKFILKKIEETKRQFEHFIESFEEREKTLLKKLNESAGTNKFTTFEIIETVRRFLKEDEGVIFFIDKGKIDFWLGKVFNPFNPIPEKRVFIIEDTKTPFLALSSELIVGKEKKRLIFIKNLSGKIGKHGVEIQFIDWREREKIEKEYINKRDFSAIKKDNKIELSSPFKLKDEGTLAIFRGSSLPDTFIKTYWKDLFLLIFYIFFFFLLVFIIISYQEHFIKKRNFLLIPFLLLFRFLLVLLKRLIFFKNFKLLRPDLSAISSNSEFFNSPIDIFLSVLTIFLILSLLVRDVIPFLEKLSERRKGFKFLIPVVFFTPLPVLTFQFFLKSIVNGTSRGLFYFLSPFPLFMIFSIFIAFLSSFIILILLFRIFYLSTESFLIKLTLVILQIPFSYFLFRKFISVPLIPSVGLFLVSALLSCNLSWAKKGSSILPFLIFVSLFLYFSLDHFLFISKRNFIEKDLKNIILAQERWSEFILREGIKEIDSQMNAIENFLFAPSKEEIAYKIWQKTTAAKLRWPSAIEVLDREGEILSSFSLNLPIPESIFIPFTDRWWVEEASLPFFDKVKRVRFGYKGVLGGKEWFGKIIFYISSDYDAIPILYRESPYYSILRGEVFPPSPVMEKDFGFAVFDEEGSIIFNPSKIHSALGRDTLKRIEKEGEFWTSTSLPLGLHHIFYFKSADRIFSIFYPVKGIKGYCLEIMEIIIISFIYFSILISFFYFLGVYKPDWLSKMTFSTKVRIIFLAMALLPFIIFSIFSNFFLQRLFIEQMKNKAIGELETAKGIFAQFYSVERESLIPQDLILWVGSIIARDINIYLDGSLVGSSRGEIFLSQFLPYHLDGEIYYEIVHKGVFYYLKKEKMGRFLYFTLSSPMKLGEQKYIISIPLIPETKELSLIGREFMEFLSIMFFFFALVASLVSQSLYRKIIGPIKTLLTAYRDVGKGNLDIKIETKSKDEIRELMEGFNSMVRELKTKQEELKEMERRQAWSEMAKKAAHEIKNPLTPILLMTEHLLKVFRENKDEFERNFEKGVNFIINEVKRLKRISSEFLTYSQETLVKERFDLKRLVEEITEPLKVTLKGKVEIKVSSNQETVYLEGDAKMIETVIRNTLLNAIEATKEKGKIEIYLVREEGEVEIIVSDNGEGIAKEDLPRIFEPYFTTKPSGTGLGLPIAKKMIELHGGKIFVESELGKGTKVIIKLPT
jgi:signal transduction histidine kinase